VAVERGGGRGAGRRRSRRKTGPASDAVGQLGEAFVQPAAVGYPAVSRCQEIGGARRPLNRFNHRREPNPKLSPGPAPPRAAENLGGFKPRYEISYDQVKLWSVGRMRKAASAGSRRTPQSHIEI
jgi:hypothetical protein